MGSPRRRAARRPAPSQLPPIRFVRDGAARLAANTRPHAASAPSHSPPSGSSGWSGRSAANVPAPPNARRPALASNAPIRLVRMERKVALRVPVSTTTAQPPSPNAPHPARPDGAARPAANTRARRRPPPSPQPLVRMEPQGRRLMRPRRVNARRPARRNAPIRLVRIRREAANTKPPRVNARRPAPSPNAPIRLVRMGRKVGG